MRTANFVSSFLLRHPFLGKSLSSFRIKNNCLISRFERKVSDASKVDNLPNFRPDAGALDEWIFSIYLSLSQEITPRDVTSIMQNISLDAVFSSVRWSVYGNLWYVRLDKQKVTAFRMAFEILTSFSRPSTHSFFPHLQGRSSCQFSKYFFTISWRIRA